MHSPTDKINEHKRPTFTKVSYNVQRLNLRVILKMSDEMAYVMWGRQWNKDQGFICSHKTLYHSVYIKTNIILSCTFKR